MTDNPGLRWPLAGTYRQLGYLILNRDPESDLPDPDGDTPLDLTLYEVIRTGPTQLLAGMPRPEPPVTPLPST